MHFCIATTQQHFGGGEVLIASIGEELQRCGHDVSWVVRADSSTQRRLEVRGSRIAHQFSGRGRSPFDILSLRKYLKSSQPDVTIMNDTHAVMLAGLASFGLGAKRPIRLAYKHTVFPLRSKYKYQKLADRLVCVSEAAQQVVVEGGMPRQDTEVIYGGVEPPNLPSVGAAERTRLRESLGVAENQKMLLAVGSLLDCKGHADLIDAVAESSGLDDTQLFIAGEGPERSHLESRIAARGISNRVRLLGHRSDVEELMHAADLLVHPSHAEGLSLVLIQAQMLQKPIVATAVGGAAEVLNAGQSQDGRWITQPGSPSELGRSLELAVSVIGDESQTSTLQAALESTGRRAESLFNISRVGQRLVTLVESISPLSIAPQNRNAA
ncbi:MAG: glycosyltransferase [Planctomycetota bacterium]